jgi:hypothetical protein
MPYYIELNTDNIVTGVLDLGQPSTEFGDLVETPAFLIDHFGDRYLGDHTTYEDKWELMEKPIIPEPPAVEPLVQVLDEFQTLQNEVNVLKKDLAQAKEENKMLQEMSQAALGELLLIQAQEQQMKGGV